MATPLNAPMAGEIWHLSIEDLFQPVQEASRLGGEGPFVINLSVSTAPINLPTKEFTSRHSAHVYQIQVTEDGRTRYRLRLGPFATEDEADAILAEVRDTYPGALTATASASDLRAIGSIQAKAEQRQSAQRPAEAQRPVETQKPDGKVIIDKAVSQKIAAQKFAVAEQPATLKADPEISIDIAWATPELAVPPRKQAPSTPTAPPTVVPPSVVSAAGCAAGRSKRKQICSQSPTRAFVHATQWTLPELDIPLPTVPKLPTVQIAPVLTEAVAPASKAAPKIAEPLSILSLAPVLTEVVLPTRTPGVESCVTEAHCHCRAGTHRSGPNKVQSSNCAACQRTVAKESCADSNCADCRCPSRNGVDCTNFSAANTGCDSTRCAAAKGDGTSRACAGGLQTGCARQTLAGAHAIDGADAQIFRTQVPRADEGHGEQAHLAAARCCRNRSRACASRSEKTRPAA